ncbi:TonB-dependent receptor [Sphingobium chlorophenolicum]|uniref:TonB-dependent receptor n=1 Tax=Sphingobium chlorophenolicum TaxID=46429 RepID=A0A081RA06_SPHCR|nr:TonB-dependent receptor [Sphingobium chlorophenolicum]KEQ52029.1 TonB-dependent receptor precursor [Sphingobium chlorophenolicum]
MYHIGMVRSALAASISAIALAGSTMACAQEASATDGASQNTGITDIVVTAQKRSQSINSVGMSITAATGDALADRGVRSVDDLAKVVPGFTYQPSPYSTPVYTIRGVGLYDSGLASSPAVSTYVDEVALPFPAMTPGATLDVERVEILKGPQGTLFGQNSTGGAINYIAAKPTSELAAGGSISYERFGLVDATGYLSGPLSDTVRARASVRVVEGGAWQYSVTRPQDRLGDSHQLYGRLLVDWDASDRLTLRLNANGFRDRSDPQAPQLDQNLMNIVAAPTTANPFAIVDPAAFAVRTNPASAGYDTSFLARQQLLYARMAGAEGPALQAGTIKYLGAPTVPENARAADWTPEYPQSIDRKFYQLSLRANYNLTDNIDLISITAYQDLRSNLYHDMDATSVSALDYHQFGSVKAFNQEVRLVGSSSAFNWIVGASYDYSKQDENANPTIPFLSLAEAVPGLPFYTFNANLKQRVNSYAAFANGELKLTDNLTFQAGIRYTESRRTADYCSADISPEQNLSTTFTALQQIFTSLGLKTTPVVPVGFAQCYQLKADLTPTITPDKRRLNEDNVSWRVGLNYKFDGGALVYANASRGFKSGMFSPIAGSTVSQSEPAVQERLDAYEGGFKLPLLNRRLQLNGAAFYYDYRNKQIRARKLDNIFGLLESLVNVPKSRVWGLEGEIVAQPFTGLNLSLGATYLKSKVKGSNVTFYNQNGYIGSFEGSRLPYTPTFTGVADAQYEWTLGDLKAQIGGTVNRHSSSNATLDTDTLPGDPYALDAYTTLDLRAGLGAADDSWRVSIFGRNVTNEYYRTTVAFSSDARYRYAARPVTYGVTFTAKIK